MNLSPCPDWGALVEGALIRGALMRGVFVKVPNNESEVVTADELVRILEVREGIGVCLGAAWPTVTDTG